MAESHDIAFDIALDADELVAEILHYLEVVELFRQEEHEPNWRGDVTTEVLR
jgi:hypothetical protein